MIVGILRDDILRLTYYELRMTYYVINVRSREKF